MTKGIVSSLFALLLLSPAAYAASPQAPDASAPQPRTAVEAVEGPVEAEQDRTRLAIDCMYELNKALPECREAAAKEKVPTDRR